MAAEQACMVGACMCGRGVCGRACIVGGVWQGVCLGGRMHGGGLCMAGACIDRANHAPIPPPPPTGQVGKLAVRILLEC